MAPSKLVTVGAHPTYFEVIYWGVQIRSLVAPIQSCVGWKGNKPKPPGGAAVVFPSTIQGDCSKCAPIFCDSVCWKWSLVPVAIMHFLYLRVSVYLTRGHFWKFWQDPELAIDLKCDCQHCFLKISILTNTTGLLICGAWFYENGVASEIGRNLICRMRQVQVKD